MRKKESKNIKYTVGSVSVSSISNRIEEKEKRREKYVDVTRVHRYAFEENGREGRDVGGDMCPKRVENKIGKRLTLILNKTQCAFLFSEDQKKNSRCWLT